MAELHNHLETHQGDVPFDSAQIFYSRTDKRGVIQAGNAVFQEISGFEWGQLLGAPHRIVRNRETPRAVFRVMWDIIQKDEIAVAYVRNKTADGRGYWVMAIVFPTAEGYLSVRIKPTTPLFAKIKSIYATLAVAEQTSDTEVEVSDAHLMGELKTLGFENYAHFQRTALQEELRARTLALGAKNKGYFADIDRIQVGLGAIKLAQNELLASVDALRDLPTNMRIVASRLEPSGGPLSAMSDIYNATSAVLFREINDFVLGKNSISRRMGDAFSTFQFLKSAVVLLDEVATKSALDPHTNSGVDAKREAQILSELSTQLALTERESLHVAERQAQDLNRTAYDLRRSMLGLDTIRVMGLVESGRLGEEGSRIGATMAQIGACHSTTISLLQKIKDNATAVNAGVEGLRMHGQKSTAIAAG